MKIKIAIGLVFIAALTRLLPHPPNFTPIGAISLFSAAYFSRKWMVWAVPFAALFLSDLVLNNTVYKDTFKGFSLISYGWLYVAFGLMIGAGYLILRNENIKPARLLVASLTASTIFFVVSNFWTWYAFDMYPKTSAGLAACFTAAIPFFQNSVLGDLFFTAVMFGIYEMATRMELVRVKA